MTALKQDSSDHVTRNKPHLRQVIQFVYKYSTHIIYTRYMLGSSKHFKNSEHFKNF